jgi:hypothetical protein
MSIGGDQGVARIVTPPRGSGPPAGMTMRAAAGASPCITRGISAALFNRYCRISALWSED